MRIFRVYVLVIALSFLPLIGFFSTSLLLHTHDGFVHLARIGAYYKALSDGQFPVRWAGDLNFGYGMPLFNFMYPLPYLIASFFVFLGSSLVGAFKITLALSLILSGIFMLGFSKAFFGDTKKAFLVTLFYQFAPFRLVEILVRGSFGEVYSYAFLPLVLWGLVLLFKKQNYLTFAMISLAVFFLIISHNAISLVFFGISLGFIAFFGKSSKNYILGILSLALGLLLSAFYWVPALLEHKFTYGDLLMKDLYRLHFPPFVNFFIPNFFNSPNLQTGGVSIQFGLFHTFVLFLAVFTLFNKKISSSFKKIIIFCLSIFLIALFFMQPISQPFWEHISFLRQFQFPWRLLSVVTFATSILAVSLFSFRFFSSLWGYFLIAFLVIFSTAYFWKPQLGMDKINESYYWNFPLNTTYFGETDVIWSEGPAKSKPKQRVEFIDGKGSVGAITKRSNFQSFTVENQTPVKLVDHTQYFPGWRAYVDGKQVPIEFQYGNYRGQIIFLVSKGHHLVKVIFAEDKVRFIADMLTLISFVSLLGYGIFRKTSL